MTQNDCNAGGRLIWSMLRSSILETVARRTFVGRERWKSPTAYMRDQQCPF